MDGFEKKTCVIDARVSTEKQLFSGGLDDQEIVCQRYATSRQWRIVKTYAKSYSGRKEEREDFEHICKEIKVMQKEGTDIDYYVIKSIDRLTRLGSGVYETMKKNLAAIGVELIDAYGVIQPEINKLEHLGVEYEWSRQSPTQIAQIIEAERSKQEVSDILVRMMSTEIALAQKGYQVRRANDGYINKEIIAEGRKVKIQIPDPERAHFYREMFNLRAKGGLTDPEIIDHINAMGFKTKNQIKWKREGKTKIAIGTIKGKPLTVKQFQRIIKKPVYAGVICEKWTHNKPIWSKSKALISIDTFNTANKGNVYIQVDKANNLKLLYNYHDHMRIIKKRHKYNPLYLYDKMILCPECKKPFLTSASRGKSGKTFPAYHCSRNHKRVSASKSDFEETITQYLKTLSIKREHFSLLEKVILQIFNESKVKVESNNQKISDTLNELNNEKQILIDQFIATENKIIKENLENRIEKIEERIQSCDENKQEISLDKYHISNFVKNFKWLMEHPEKKLINNQNPVKQQELFRLIFDGYPTYSEILNRTPKLSPIFSILGVHSTSKSQVVTPQGLGWNTLEKTINSWNGILKETEEDNRSNS